MMYNIAIIGAGPAGGSAAIFAAKAGKRTVVIDHDKGVTKRALVKNHYGIDQIDGPDLVEQGIKQATSFGAKFLKGEATNIEKKDDYFVIETDNETVKATHVILATGLATDLAKKIGVHTKDATEPRINTICDVDADGRTNIERIWAAGTVAGVSVHTIITAGDGAKVAVNVISEINGERYVDHDILQ